MPAPVSSLIARMSASCDRQEWVSSLDLVALWEVACPIPGPARSARDPLPVGDDSDAGAGRDDRRCEVICPVRGMVGGRAGAMVVPVRTGPGHAQRGHLCSGAGAGGSRGGRGERPSAPSYRRPHHHPRHRGLRVRARPKSKVRPHGPWRADLPGGQAPASCRRVCRGASPVRASAVGAQRHGTGLTGAS